MRNLFGNTIIGDCHPELPRGLEYHRGEWGMGSASIEEAWLLYGLITSCKPQLVIETGTETGWTTAWIAQALTDAAYGRLITVEKDQKKAQAASERIAGMELASRVEVVCDDSLKAIASLSDYSVDFAFLDTLIHLRLLELQALRTKLKPGAIVVIHDTSPQHPMAGNTKLLDELQKNCKSILHINSPRGITILQPNLPDKWVRSERSCIPSLRFIFPTWFPGPRKIKRWFRQAT